MKIKPFLLERYFAKYEFTAPYLLCSSDCETISIENLLSLSGKKEELLNSFLKLKLGYTQSKGDPVLRQKISKIYNSNKIGEEDVLTFSGAAEGIFLLINSIVDKSDHVISIFPAYQSLYEVVKSIGAEIDLWKLEEKEGWFLNIDKLKKMIKKNTRLLIINFPHNPTGFCPSNEEYEEIISICDKNGIYLFSDEVYRFLEYDINIGKDNEVNIIERKTHASACELYENAISLGVMSKSFGLAGLRIGWIATKNKDILKKVSFMKDYTTICSSAPSEFLASIALDNSDVILKMTKKIIFENLIYLVKFFDKYKEHFNFIYPKGGSVAFPSFYKDTDRLSRELIEFKGVLLMPSSMFEYDKRHFRIGFGRKNMKEALSLFDQYCQQTLR